MFAPRHHDGCEARRETESLRATGLVSENRHATFYFKREALKFRCSLYLALDAFPQFRSRSHVSMQFQHFFERRFWHNRKAPICFHCSIPSKYNLSYDFLEVIRSKT